jgi:hypothetical protein
MNDLKSKAPEPESDSQQVQAFLTQMEGLIARHPLWANSTPEELEAATEVGALACGCRGGPGRRAAPVRGGWEPAAEPPGRRAPRRRWRST